jgi:hypothetical protein
VIVDASLQEAWSALSRLYTVRGPAGVARLEEADDDTHRAAWRYRGSTVTATLEADGERTRLHATDLEDVLVAAIRPSRFVAASAWRRP